MNINASEMRKIANEKLKVQNDIEFEKAMKIIEKRIIEESSKGKFAYTFRNTIITNCGTFERIIAHLEYHNFKVAVGENDRSLVISW